MPVWNTNSSDRAVAAGADWRPPKECAGKGGLTHAPRRRAAIWAVGAVWGLVLGGCADPALVSPRAGVDGAAVMREAAAPFASPTQYVRGRWFTGTGFASDT